MAAFTSIFKTTILYRRPLNKTHEQGIFVLAWLFFSEYIIVPKRSVKFDMGFTLLKMQISQSNKTNSLHKSKLEGISYSISFDNLCRYLVHSFSCTFVFQQQQKVHSL